MLDYPVYVRMPTEDDKPYLENRSAAEAVIAALINAQNQGWLRLHGFVVLPAALEMVMSPIRQGVAGVVAHLQAETMPVLSALKPESVMFWSNRFTHGQITSQKALNARLEMLRLAPIASGITDDASNFPHSFANPRYKANIAVYAGFTQNQPAQETESKRTGQTGKLTLKTDMVPNSSTEKDNQTSTSTST